MQKKQQPKHAYFPQHNDDDGDDTLGNNYQFY